MMTATKVLPILCVLMALLCVTMAAPPTLRRRPTPWHVNFTRPDPKVGKIVSSWDTSNEGNPEELGTYFEGDIMMPQKPLPVTRNGVDYAQYQWENGVIPYEISSTIGEAQLTNIKTALSKIEEATCVQFIPRTDEANYISVQNKDTGCWSYIGRKGGMQELNLQTRGCSGVGTSMHEMMHTLGFFHEHTRDDRDQYVTIQFQNVQSGKEGNFDIWPYRKNTYGVPYDYGSILHYSATAFTSNGQPTIVTKVPDMKIGQRIAMTEGDIERINSMYKCEITK